MSDSIQKAEEIEVNGAKEVKGRTQKASIGYSLKAMSEHVNKLVEGGFWDEKDKAKYKELHTKALNKFIGDEYGV